MKKINNNLYDKLNYIHFIIYLLTILFLYIIKENK